MTIKERNEMVDRARIKQFIEKSIREVCDDISDTENADAGVVSEVFEYMETLSRVYVNLGLNKNDR